MNERGNPVEEFEHAPKQFDDVSASSESPSESAEHQNLVTAYSRRSRRAAGAPSADDRAQHAHTGGHRAGEDKPDYRLRDFRPTQGADEARPGAESDGRLSYQTQAVPPTSQQAPAKPVVDSVPPGLAAPPRPMTRRELRELEARQGLRPQANDAPISPPESPVHAAPEAQAPKAQAPKAQAPEAQASEAPAPPAPPVAPPVVHLAPPIPVPPPAPVPSPVAQPPAPPVASPEPVIFTDASGAPPANRAPVAPMPVRQPGAAPQPTAGSLAINRGIDSAPEIFSAPDAHWQTQTHIDAANQSDAAFIRRVGSTGGALTTNALVIPSIPQASDITRPFSSTGEILVTGSIELPITLGSTGANPARYDNADIDALFAKEDHDYAPADAAPVRAIRAVSTHTSTHGVISAKKPANNRLPMMMAVTAGILAVSVAALFAAALIFGYL